MVTLRLVRGDTWYRRWQATAAAGQPVDLSGATARLHLRRVADGTLAASATTADGRIAIDAAAGTLDLRMPATATASLAPGRYRYDIEVTMPDGAVRTIEAATVVVIEDMARG